MIYLKANNTKYKLDLSNIKLDKTKKSFLSKLYFKIIELF